MGKKRDFVKFIYFLNWDLKHNILGNMIELHNCCINLCLQEFHRASPSETPSGKGLYLTVQQALTGDIGRTQLNNTRKHSQHN